MGEKISREERILGLSRIWRDVKYCFARYYEVTSDKKWDALYCEYLPLVAEAEDNIGIIGFHVCTSDVKENLYQNALS